MADQKISELTAASSVGATDTLAAEQSGASRKVTPAQIFTYGLAQNDTVSGNWTFTGNFVQNTGTCTISGVTALEGAITATGTANFQDAVDCDSTLNCDGAVTFTSTLAVTGNTNVDGTLTLNGPLIAADDGELTISTGSITVTGTYHTVAGEGAANDNLDTIVAGSADGQIVILRKASAAHDITVRNGNGNIYLNSATDFNLNHRRDTLMLMWCAELSEWLQVGGSGNASND